MSEPDTALILVVDNDPRDRELFRRILEGAGYSVTEAFQPVTSTSCAANQ